MQEECYIFNFNLSISSQLCFFKTAIYTLNEMGLKHSTTKSFYYAFSGLKEAFLKEPNLRVHFLFATIAITFGFVLKISNIEWVIITLAIFYVISLELLNTVIESLVNLLSPEIRTEAKMAKDVSASVVLSAAILSVIIGALIFFPKIVVLVN